MKHDFTIDPSLLPALAAFACVARHASFNRAAIELGMSPSALSQSIRNLERRLGTRLLHRTTRRVGLTEPGERLLREAAPALARIGGALQALEETRDVPAGRLRITAPGIAIERLVLPHLPAFCARHPQVEVEVARQAALADLVAEGFDAGIRLGESLAEGMVAVPLGPPQRLVVVGAPDYLRRHPPPDTPEALAGHACIRYRRSDGRLMPWEFTRDGHDFSVEVRGALVFNDSGLGRQMAVAGLGLAQVFEAAAEQDIAAGRLLRLLDDWQSPFPGFHLYYPSREQLAPKLRVFVDFLRQANATPPPLQERTMVRSCAFVLAPAPAGTASCTSLHPHSGMRRHDRLLNRLWAHEKASYGLRVFVALSAVLALCWYRHDLQPLPSLFLGIIASAIAETDDNARGRIKSVLLSLLCFVAAAAAVAWLFPHPLPFIAALALAAFALTLLGALGERYASIGQATVTLALYAMVALDEHPDATPAQAWRELWPLLAGAAWYGLLSVLWTAVFANRPVRERLARLFAELGRYLQLKADLFEPVRQDNLQARRLALAEQNVRVVEALNAAKAAILSRFGRSGRPGVQSGLYFRLYYMAQDFHERASSSHYPYEALTEAFFHSDVLYRCRRLLSLQGQACAALGQAIRLRQPFDYGAQTHQAGQDLQQSLHYLRAQANPQWRRLLGSLQLLEANLSSIARQLSEASLADTPLEGIDTRLRDSSPHTLREMATRLRQALTPGSLLFRHGVRIALALVAGYALLKLVHPQNGYWILLTIVFVCRPHFGATRLRLVQRVAGTLVGLGATWALMQLFPGTTAQVLLALAAALLFFVTRNERYVIATAAITLMALLCFNLLGNGFVMIWPRLLDTLIGCAIAAAASLLVLPDWQGRRLHRVMAQVITACTGYLEAVLGQYRSGMRDDLPYRIARRDMHNADVALSVALANMLREPGYARGNLEAGFRFLALSNTLLGYLSALGAHRARLEDYGDDALIEQGGTRLRQALEQIASALAARQPLAATDESADAALAQALEQTPDEIDSRLRLIRTQLALMLQLLPQLREAANAASAPASTIPVAASPA